MSDMRSGRNSYLADTLCLSRLSASFIKFQLKLSRLCSGQGRIRFFFFFFFFGTKGQVTPNSIVRSGRNSNSFEILCLSRLSASLMKIRLKLKDYVPDKVRYVFSAFKGK